MTVYKRFLTDRMFIQQVGNNSGTPDGDRRYTDYNLGKAGINTTRLIPWDLSLGWMIPGFS